MKKIAVLFITLFVLTFVFSSCASQKCAAYGEVHKYQRESKY